MTRGRYAVVVTSSADPTTYKLPLVFRHQTKRSARAHAHELRDEYPPAYSEWDDYYGGGYAGPCRITIRRWRRDLLSRLNTERDAAIARQEAEVNEHFERMIDDDIARGEGGCEHGGHFMRCAICVRAERDRQEREYQAEERAYERALAREREDIEDEKEREREEMGYGYEPPGAGRFDLDDGGAW